MVTYFDPVGFRHTCGAGVAVMKSSPCRLMAMRIR